MKNQRIHFIDTVPHAIPESLEELVGPESGFIDLPLYIWWQPNGDKLDIGNKAIAEECYQALLSWASLDDLKRYVNKNKLIELWPTMRIDPVIISLWQERFPELGHNFREVLIKLE